MKKLTAYIVGGNDIVAHYSKEEALHLLNTEFDYSDYEFTIDDVSECSSEVMNSPIMDADGKTYPSIAEDLKTMTEPRHLLGWE